MSIFYNSSSHISLDRETFSLREQSYSSIFTIIEDEMKSTCWSNSDDGDDDFYACFNGNGEIDLSYSY